MSSLFLGNFIWYRDFSGGQIHTENQVPCRGKRRKEKKKALLNSVIIDNTATATPVTAAVMTTKQQPHHFLPPPPQLFHLYMHHISLSFPIHMSSQNSATQKFLPQCFFCVTLSQTCSFNLDPCLTPECLPFSSMFQSYYRIATTTILKTCL